MDPEPKHLLPPASQPINTDGGPHLIDTDRTFLASYDNLDLLELHQKFVPFARTDVYGTMGRGDLPLEEKFLLAASFATLVPLRLTVGSAIVVLYYLICRFCTGLTVSDGDDEMQGGFMEMVGWRRAMVVYSGRFLARAMLFTLGFYWIDESYLTACDDEYQETDEVEVSLSTMKMK